MSFCAIFLVVIVLKVYDYLYFSDVCYHVIYDVDLCDILCRLR